MRDKLEQVRGRGKEAVGRLFGNKDLESQGKTDRRVAEAKAKVSHAKDKVEEVIDKVNDVPNRK